MKYGHRARFSPASRRPKAELATAGLGQRNGFRIAQRLSRRIDILSGSGAFVKNGAPVDHLTLANGKGPNPIELAKEK